MAFHSVKLPSKEVANKMFQMEQAQGQLELSDRKKFAAFREKF